jgi:hypothetical protein
MSKLTLEDAISHCLKVAEQNETQADKIGRQFIGSAMDKRATDCRECAADHRQLAEWLQELRAYRKLEICGNCRHYVVGTTHFGECHVTSDIEPCVVGVNQAACGKFDYKDFRNGVEKPQP